MVKDHTRESLMFKHSNAKLISFLRMCCVDREDDITKGCLLTASNSQHG